MPRQRHQVPAVVLGLSPTGLGIVRSLAPFCSHIVGVESNTAEPGVHTRLCRVHTVSSLSDHDALLRELITLGLSLPGKPVLFLSSDEHVTWAVRVADRLREHYRLVLPQAEIADALMFKDRFSALAARENLPMPRGAFLPVLGLETAAESSGLRPPLVIKPANKAGAWERAGLAKAYIARSDAEVREVAAKAAGLVDRVLVQEYLEGDDAAVYFCLRLAAPGLPRAVHFCGRKLLQWPPLRGSTAVAEPVHAPDLEAFTASLFDRLGVDGFSSLEVKYLPDGTFRIIEPTVGRVDLQSYLATLNGVNMPMAAYLAAIGQGDEAGAFLQRGPRDVVWIYEESLVSLLRTGAVSSGVLYDLARRPKGYALARWNDPLVFGAFAERKLEGLARRARAALGV